jgi:hypothetical protein
MGHSTGTSISFENMFDKESNEPKFKNLSLKNKSQAFEPGESSRNIILRSILVDVVVVTPPRFIRTPPPWALL